MSSLTSYFSLFPSSTNSTECRQGHECKAPNQNIDDVLCPSGLPCLGTLSSPNHPDVSDRLVLYNSHYCHWEAHMCCKVNKHEYNHFQPKYFFLLTFRPLQLIPESMTRKICSLIVFFSVLCNCHRFLEYKTVVKTKVVPRKGKYFTWDFFRCRRFLRIFTFLGGSTFLSTTPWQPGAGERPGQRISGWIPSTQR